MTVLLPALGVAFAAFCVWLGVRVVNRRERWAKRTAVAMAVVLVLYPLSLGPSCWISSRMNIGSLAVSVVFRPMLCAFSSDYTGRLEDGWIRWYSELAADNAWGWWQWPDDDGKWRWATDHGSL